MISENQTNVNRGGRKVNTKGEGIDVRALTCGARFRVGVRRGVLPPHVKASTSHPSRLSTMDDTVAVAGRDREYTLRMGIIDLGDT